MGVSRGTVAPAAGDGHLCEEGASGRLLGGLLGGCSEAFRAGLLGGCSEVPVAGF